MQAQRRWQPASLVCGRSVFASLWRWPLAGRRIPRCWAAEGPWWKHSLAGSCATALQISACSAPTFPTHHFPSWAHPLARRERSQRGEVWLWRRDVKKTCTQPTGSPVQSDYSCWRPNARRHGLGERECLVLVGRDHCAATWMKGIFFIITKIRQAMKDTFFHQGRRRYPA